MRVPGRLRSIALMLLAMLALAACQSAVVAPPPPAPPPVPEAVPLPPPVCPRLSFYEEGIASWYGRTHHGRPTASGALFDMNQPSAAHRRLEFGTRIRVTNTANGRAVELTVNDRGPNVRGRILDLSQRAAQRLGFETNGTTRVRIELIEPC